MLWSRALEEVEKGRESCLGTAYHTAEREKKFLFSDSYYESQVALIRKQSTSDVDWSVLEDFKGKTFVVVKDNSYGKEFDEADFLKKHTTPDESISLALHFLRGIGDYVVMDPLVTRTLLKKEPFIKRKIKWATITRPLSRNKLYLICSKAIKNMKNTVKDFNAGLSEIKKDSKIQDILKKHGISEQDF